MQLQTLDKTWNHVDWKQVRQNVYRIQLRIAKAVLEEASVNQNIIPFADFLAGLVDAGLNGKATPELPST